MLRYRRIRIESVSTLRVTAREDIAAVAGQLAELTRTVEEMARQLAAVSQRADSQQERAEARLLDYCRDLVVAHLHANQELPNGPITVGGGAVR
jgi:hypothetical protein